MLLGYRCRGSLMKCAWVYLTQRRWICKLTGCRLSARCITADLIQTAVIHIETYLHFKLSRTLRIHPLSLSLYSTEFLFLPDTTESSDFLMHKRATIRTATGSRSGCLIRFARHRVLLEVNPENLTDELPARQSESNYHYWILSWVNIGRTDERCFVISREPRERELEAQFHLDRERI